MYFTCAHCGHTYEAARRGCPSCGRLPVSEASTVPPAPRPAALSSPTDSHAITATLVLDTLQAIDAQLEYVESLADAVRLHQHADVLQFMTRKASLAHEIQNSAARTRLNAERRIGQLLQTMPKNAGGRPPKNPSSNSDGFEDRPTYADLGLDYYHTERWQAIAALPANEYQTFLAEALEAGRDLTTAAVFRYAQNWRKKHRGGVTTCTTMPCPRCGGSGEITVTTYEERADDHQ